MRNARTDSHLIKKLFEHYCVIAIFSGVLHRLRRGAIYKAAIQIS